MKVATVTLSLVMLQFLAALSPTEAQDKKPVVNNSGVNRHPYSADLRAYIVEKHNWARGHLVPTEASNMRKLKWDETLAISASDLVETCRFEHFTDNSAYGQNLIMQHDAISKASIDRWMVEWVTKEISHSDRQGNGVMDLDHASAVLWAKTYLVGCATKECNGKYLTACNYFTPGNWQGEKTYEPGQSCSQCPSEASQCDASGKLCTSDRSDGVPMTIAPRPNPEKEHPLKPTTEEPTIDTPCPESSVPTDSPPVTTAPETPCPESEAPRELTPTPETPCPSNSHGATDAPTPLVTPATSVPGPHDQC